MTKMKYKQRVQESDSGAYTYDFIKQYIRAFQPTNTPNLPFEKKVLVNNPSLCTSPKRKYNKQNNTPMRQVADQKTIQLKKHLSERSENGGWVTLSKRISTEDNEIKFNLNILTPNNFDSIVEVIFKLCHRDNNQVRRLVQILISKSQFETKYHAIYSRLCSELIKKYRTVEVKMEINKYLQQSLVYIERAVNFDQKIRKEFFNKIIFFSELFLAEVIYRDIFDRLVLNYLIKYLKEADRHEYLQSLIILFDKVGKYELSHPSQQNQNTITESEKIIKNPGLLKNQKSIQFSIVFGILSIIKDKSEINNRLRSLIKNLLQRRNQKWKDTLQQSQKPMTLEQIKLQSTNSLNCNQNNLKYVEITMESVEEQIQLNLKRINVKLLEELAKKQHSLFIDMFVTRFYQHKMDSIESLINLMHRLIDQHILDLKELIQSIQLKIQILCCDDADFPFLKKSIAQLLKPYLNNKLIQLDCLDNVVSTQEEQEFVESLKRLLKKQ